jgi:hypothetical protein
MANLEESALAQLNVPQPQLSNEVMHFCAKHGILPYLSIAIDLIKTCFSSLQDLHLQPEQDPETGEEWLGVDVTLQGNQEQVLAAYDKYTDDWVSAVPWPVRQKIRLSYTLV